MSKPMLTIQSDGTLTIHEPLTVGDALALLEAAKNGILSLVMQSTDNGKELDNG